MIVLQANKFFWEKGGAERYLFSLSRALEERGHEVVPFAMEHPANADSPWSEYFVPRRDYDEGVDVGAVAGFIRSPDAARRIRRLVRRVRPDVAHLHNIYHQLTPSIIEVLAAEGVPVVMTLHDYKLVCPNYNLFARGAFCYRCRGGRFYQAALTRCHGGSLSRSVLLALEAYWQKWSGVYGRVARFMAPSRYMEGIARDGGRDPGRVVHVPPFVDPPARRADDRAAATGGDGYVLYFGRLSAEKGVDILLDAVAEHGHASVVICGDGPERERLEARARARLPGRARFMGHLGRDALERILDGAGVAVLPALCAENAPYTVLESAVHGVPVVVSNQGGLPEMAEVVGGWVTPAGDAHALARALDQVLADPDAARARARAGRERALAAYDRTHHIDRIEAIYGEVTQRARGGRG